jgi:glycosyltransferase involved in cell wall biosynthesis
MTGRYVTAFAGPRDGYEVPLALNEGGMLERLVTDFYLPDWARGLAPYAPLGLPDALRKRYRAGLSSRFVDNNWESFARQLRDPRRLHDPVRMAFVMDRAVSLQASAAARATDSHLFLHNGAAYWAFEASPDRRRLLFQFHPHRAFIYPLLAEDLERFPEVRASFATQSDSAPLERIAPEPLGEWRLADAVLCASAFTKASLVAQGCAPRRIAIAPYGAQLAMGDLPRKEERGRRCRFLFVGQGVQRKGLHHLLRAWRAADLKDCDLRLVCSKLDPGLLPLTRQANVDLSAKISLAELRATYLASDIFVMPSIVEGFGLVYPEAMSAGLFCIGTRNTGLPDLEPPADVADIIGAGDLDGLAQSLVSAHARWREGATDVGKIRAFARTHTWENFRRRVRLFASNPPGADGPTAPLADP